MIKQIIVRNRFYMELIVRGLKTIDLPRWHLISISGVDNKYFKHSLFTNDVNSYSSNHVKEILSKQNCVKMLPLQFDDIVDTDIESQVKNTLLDGTVLSALFSKSQAIEVINFIECISREKEDSTLIVHCHAGISRSGAIAQFVSDIFEIPFKDPEIRPNTYVLKLLKEVYNERYPIKTITIT